MIIGIGMDLSEAAFWSQALADPTTSVIEGTFTPAELADANAGPTPPADRLATRFAAKEAFTPSSSSISAFSMLSGNSIPLSFALWIS